MSSLFSCKNFERKENSESRKMDGISKDGTTLGILRTLPKFYRHTKVVKAVLRSSNVQYVVKNPKLRGFVNSILCSAKVQVRATYSIYRSKELSGIKGMSLFQQFSIMHYLIFMKPGLFRGFC